MKTPKPKTRGRKSLLNAKLQKQICSLLERGHTIGTVCGACGFSERSFFDWCEKDAAFFAATQRARAAGRVRIVEEILDSDDWRAKSWYLERTAPGQFGRTEPRVIVIERPAEPLSTPEPVKPPGAMERWFTPKAGGIPLDKESLNYLATLRRHLDSPPPRSENGDEEAS